MPDVTVGANEVSSGKVMLVADEVSTVTLSSPRAVEIVSDGTAEVWYAVSNDEPTVGGKHCYYIPAAVSVDQREVGGNDGNTLSFISDGTPTLVVQHA